MDPISDLHDVPDLVEEPSIDLAKLMDAVDRISGSLVVRIDGAPGSPTRLTEVRGAGVSIGLL